MRSELAEEYAERLQSALGEPLRTVAVGDLEHQLYEVVYMREDIGELYPAEKRDEIVRDALLENVAERRQEELFSPLGALNFTTRVFDGGINVYCWIDEDEAVFVGLGEEIGLIEPTISICRELYGDE
jgi:hypothetical protein